jgi:hypothetical protein
MNLPRRGDGRGRTSDRHTDDTGGVWIVTGVVLGVLVYAGIVTMAVAGFSAVVPLVVIPPVLVGLIGANNLIGGGRDHGRSPGRPVGRGQAPLSSSGPNGPVPSDQSQATGSPAAEEPRGSR